MVDFLGYNSPYRKRESTSGRLSTLPRASKPLRKTEPGLERLNIVLRQRNRETPPPVMGKETKYSKFSPLPAIKPRAKPKLLREKTYDVLEPVYVKGPPPQEEKMKLPEIKKPGGGGKSALIGGSPRRAASRGGQLVTPKRNKTITAEPLPNKLRQAFNPNNVVTNSDVPNNVFWFPM